MRTYFLSLLFCLAALPLFSQLTTMVGIGVRLQIDSTTLGYKAAKIIAFLPGGSAENSGLKVGDFLMKIDGKSAVKLSIEEVTNLIKGPEGSTAKLEIKRGSETKTFSMLRKTIQASATYYTSETDSPLGKGLAALINDAPYNFKNTIDSTTYEVEGAGFTRNVYPSKIKIPGVKSVHMVKSFGTTCRIRFGSYTTMDEVNKNGEKFVAELEKCFPKFYFSSVNNGESNKIQIGSEGAKGYSSALMEMYSYKDGDSYHLELRVENGAPSLFYYVPKAAQDTDFSRAFNKIYGEVTNKFEKLKGTQHEEGDFFNTAYWYDANLVVPGAGKSYIYGGSGMISTPLRFISLFYNGPDKEKAKEAYKTVANAIFDVIGPDFVYTFDKPNELIEQVIHKEAVDFVIFAKRKEKGYEKVPVALLMVAPSEGGNYSLSLVFYETAL